MTLTEAILSGKTVMTAPATLKAYIVTEDDEGNAEIVFAQHNAVARRKGATEFVDGDFYSVNCRRAPEFDSFAPGPVPLEVKIEHGWWQECFHCGRSVSQDAIDSGDDDEDEGCDDRGPMKPVYVGLNTVYCTAWCQGRELGEKYGREIYGAAAIAALRAQVVARFGEVKFCTGEYYREHVYVSFGDGVARIEQCVVSFEFPGQTIGPASFCLDRNDYQRKREGVADQPYYVCSSGDVATFKAWADATKLEKVA